MIQNGPHNITALKILSQFKTGPHAIQNLLNIIRYNSYLSQCSLCKLFADYKCMNNNRTDTNCIVNYQSNLLM